MRIKAVMARTLGRDWARAREARARAIGKAFRMARLYHAGRMGSKLAASSPNRAVPPASSFLGVDRRPVIVLRGIGLRRHNKHWPPTVKHPLLGPLAALASGILVYRFVPLGPSESLGAIGGFFVLGCLALWRGSRALASVCCLLGLFFAGALDSRVHEHTSELQSLR